MQMQQSGAALKDSNDKSSPVLSAEIPPAMTPVPDLGYNVKKLQLGVSHEGT